MSTMSCCFCTLEPSLWSFWSVPSMVHFISCNSSCKQHNCWLFLSTWDHLVVWILIPLSRYILFYQFAAWERLTSGWTWSKWSGQNKLTPAVRTNCQCRNDGVHKCSWLTKYVEGNLNHRYIPQHYTLGSPIALTQTWAILQPSLST